jgi:hypothetical protein
MVLELQKSYKVGYRVLQTIDFKGYLNDTIIEWE